jgi:hypothetical protein
VEAGGVAAEAGRVHPEHRGERAVDLDLGGLDRLGAGHPGLPGHRGPDLAGQREGRDDQQVGLLQAAQRGDRGPLGGRGRGAGLRAASRRSASRRRGPGDGDRDRRAAASAWPPSMGTTGPIVVAGAGLDRGIPRAAAPTAAGLPPTVASTTPVAVPASTSTLISTGIRRLGFAEDGTSRRQRRRTASASECIGPNITPQDTVPGGCLPGQGTPAPARYRRQAEGVQVRRAGIAPP